MGKFIVIEGLDGSGKTTQTALLTDYMKKKGSVRELSFPRYGEKSCTLVDMYLSGELSDDPEATNAYTASSFFALDRYISYVTDWKKDIEDENKTVIATRYTTSNAYHQLSKLPREEWDSFLSWIFDYEFEKLMLPKPDKVILLLMDPKISQNKVRERSEKTGQKMDIHEKDTEYINKCYEAASYAAEKCRWTVVHCAPDGIQRSIDDIFEEIKKIVEDK